MIELAALSGELHLAGSLWLPDEPAVALLLMHPGSGPSDRDNDVFFPPIRAALLAAGVAVASFDKRGAGGSEGDWQEAGVEEQADDLFAGLAAARARVPGVPAGVFGHSQGGWVVQAAAARGGVDFAVTSSGPAVTVGEQERYAMRCALERSSLTPDERARADAVNGEMYALAERGATYEELLAWAADPARAAEVAVVVQAFGDELPERGLWNLLLRLATFQPSAALAQVAVPLLAVFGADDCVTPTVASAAVLETVVRPDLLTVAVLEGGNHRMSHAGSTDFVGGYPDVVVRFVLARAGQSLTT